MLLFYSYMPLDVYHIYLYIDLKLGIAHRNHEFIGITAENKIKVEMLVMS